MDQVIIQRPDFDLPFPTVTVYEGPPLITGSVLTPDQIRLLDDEYIGISGSNAYKSRAAQTMYVAPPEQKTTVEDLVAQVMDKMYGDHCAKAVVKCGYCGQFGARFCACRHCGGAID